MLRKEMVHMDTKFYPPVELDKKGHFQFVKFALEEAERILHTENIVALADSLEQNPHEVKMIDGTKRLILDIDYEDERADYAGKSIPDFRWLDNRYRIIGEAKTTTYDAKKKRTIKQWTDYFEELENCQEPNRHLVLAFPYKSLGLVQNSLNSFYNNVLGYRPEDKGIHVHLVSEIDGKIIEPPKDYEQRLNEKPYISYEVGNGKTFVVENRMMSLDELVYDEGNYRLIGIDKPQLTQEECYAALIAEKDVDDVRDAINRRVEILQQRCITKPLIVYPERDENGNIIRYVIYDGNSRHAHSYYIVSRAKEAHGYEKIPVQIYLNATKEELDQLKFMKQHETTLKHSPTQDAITVWHKHHSGMSNSEIEVFFNGVYNEKLIDNSWKTIDFLKKEGHLNDDQLKRIYLSFFEIYTHPKATKVFWNKKELTRKGFTKFTQKAVVKRLLMEYQNSGDRTNYLSRTTIKQTIAEAIAHFNDAPTEYGELLTKWVTTCDNEYADPEEFKMKLASLRDTYRSNNTADNFFRRYQEISTKLQNLQSDMNDLLDNSSDEQLVALGFTKNKSHTISELWHNFNELSGDSAIAAKIAKNLMERSKEARQAVAEKKAS